MEKNLKGIPLLFENDYCMVFNKPAGLAVQGGEGVKVSLDSILSSSYKTRPLLVHRLDKDTSGIILVAKDSESAAAFTLIFGAKGKESQGSFGSKHALKPLKKYIAVCKDIPNPPSGIILLDLDIRGQKKKTETSYKLLKTIEAGEINTSAFSFLELELGTGRMHQIRRHLMLIGHPLLGDDKYGDFSLNKTLRKTMGLKKLLLHAFNLVIPPFKLLPQGLDIICDPPDYFSEFIGKLACKDAEYAKTQS